jgi:hypothetical protein
MAADPEPRLCPDQGRDVELITIAAAQATESISLNRWLITADTPSPRIVTP